MNPVRLAVDMSGGDHGSAVVMEGILEAQRRNPGSFHARLCGDGTVIAGLLKQSGIDLHDKAAVLSIEHCPQSATENDAPTRTWKTRPGSSIIRCVALQQEAKADASVSAGDTGTLMSAAIFILGRTRDIVRPALAAFLPTAAGTPVLLLDVGANLNCRPEHLAAFAAMGKGYMNSFYGIQSPRVALLNIGKEPRKGTPVVTKTDALLRNGCPGYEGYIEGSHVLAGDADVVVCDGFAGNVLLKACESFFGLTQSVLGRNDPRLLESIRRSMTIFNPENYGAAPFLGINGTVLKAHGSSSSRAIARAVTVAVTAVQRNVLPHAAAACAKGNAHSYAE